MTQRTGQGISADGKATGDFPVTWSNPGDAKLFWMHDRMHFPQPFSAMDFVAQGDCFARGFTKAVKAAGAPLQGCRVQRINGYRYWAIVPLMEPPEEMARIGAQAEKNLGAAMARLGELWEREWLPQMKTHLAFWDKFDLRGASVPALVEHLDQTIERMARMWELHFSLVLPMYIALSQFDEVYRDLFGNEGALEAYKLLQGYDNKTVETGRELWRLSRKARASTPVQRTLTAYPPAEIIPALEQTAEGRTFLGELRAFLNIYGLRGENISLEHPGWIEDPMPVIKNLQDYVRQPDQDPWAQIQAQAAERDRLVGNARERLKGYPAAAREGFEFLLRAAQMANPLSEEHTYYMEFGVMFRARRVLMELGHRFAQARVLDRAQDIMLLTPDEIRQTAGALPRTDRRPLAALRRTELQQAARMAPPPALGTPPPADAPRDAMSVAVGKLFGTPVAPSEKKGTIKGHPGSPGKATGKARVARTLGEAGRLQKGEILVAETTVPSWTPLFATAGAVVTDTGGALSHCAIVAREYRIPAVVGTGNATSVLHDGQTIEVDGAEGTVRIVE